ncbi:serine protease hepsin isoform X1 [Nerophis ophidion]|uniref:serine protease hepsin isoform X1 n=1 Tax=Nerophis ophidion TaxID=159077 RepID=UPI002ADF71A7|nr:serine protease hepsin isoform X1 [Nerophis ophidion]XP_061772294.1 serine protease hepsin isoform X1 [Nerophis ophidion]XP_061772295.1 serine protease hepsin isoform X1 [Nerophis ophidion]
MYAEKIGKESKMGKWSKGISLTCVLTPCRVMGLCVMLMTLAAIGAAIWAVVSYCTLEEDTGYYDVQVNSADQHLRVFDSAHKRWRQVCSSSANEMLASISCEEVGFVSVVNYSITSVSDAGGEGGEFFCVRTNELSYGKKIKDSLFPCDCESKEVLTLLCQDCGRRSFAADRIVGGINARQGSWPWQVSLQYNGDHQCGGSIISDRWIVSAAHCFPARLSVISRWRVLLGSIYNKPGNAIVAEVKTIVYHSSYLPFVDPNIDDNSRDIAVLALTQPLTFNEYIQPVCLPAYGQRLIDGQMGTVTGWGNVEYFGNPANVLQEVNIPIISDAVCNAPDYYDNQITTSMFCAGYVKGNVDSCQGDSGGPFVAEDCLSKTSRYRLLGVVSWGTGCAMAKKPGVYSRVSRFLPWISTAMRNYNNSPGVHKMART